MGNADRQPRRGGGAASAAAAIGLGLAACTAPAAPPAAPPARPAGLRGATIGGSGYPTIPYAPAAPYPIAFPGVQPWERPTALGPEPGGGRGDVEVYMHMREAGVGFEEAKRRVAQKNADRREAMALDAKLRAREAGNYAGRYLQRVPTLAYAFQFKSDPQGTLRRHGANPRFVGRQVRFTGAELDAVREDWGRRMTGLWDGAGVEVDRGVARFSMTVTEPEFRAVASRNGWRLPDTVALDFAPEPDLPPVSEAARSYVRIFPQAARSLNIQLANAIIGPITMRDGCLFTGTNIAYFGREMGLFVDEAGYLALRNRMGPGETYARIGERMVWSGTSRVIDDPAVKAAVRARCGDHPIVDVATPTSYAAWRFRPHEVDALARRRGVTREAALAMWRQCWAREDEAYRETQLGGPRNKIAGGTPPPPSACEADVQPPPAPPPPPGRRRG